MVKTGLDMDCHELEYVDNWVWDCGHKSSKVVLSPNSRAAYFHVNPLLESTGTAGVRGNKPFCDGEHYWEIEFVEPPAGTSVMIGVGTKEAVLDADNYQYVDLIGKDKHSWGLSYKGKVWHNGHCHQYCEPFYTEKTVLGVHLNMYTGTLSFYKDGKNLGVAFEGLNCGKVLYPIISSTAVNTELEVGKRACRYLSLQEKCALIIARSLGKSTDVEALPLPYILKDQISELVC